MRSLACALTLLTVAAAGLNAQSPSADDTMRLAGAYVDRFIVAFSNVVAEERYVQEIVSPRRERTLRSDFLLVRYPGATKWHAFRDVLEVDGAPVADDREDRLARLFLAPAPDALQRATEIARAGSRHHLTRLEEYNNPLLVLSFLQPEDQSQFRFTRAGLEPSIGPAVRTFGFQLGGLMARTRRDPLRGRVWIDEKTGRVVKTELEVGSQQFPRRVATLFTTDARLGIDVPAEMRYTVSRPVGGEHGTATYGNFRRFQVRTEVQ